MNFLIAFLSSFFGINWLSLQPIQECRTTEFTTLMYHHIREYSNLDVAAKNISVSPEEFDMQMKYLSENGYTPITSSDIRNGTVPCKSIMITFDDGYHDVFTHAYPAMKRYGYVWIIGLILAKVDESDYLNWTQIRELQKEWWEIASHTWHHPNLSNLWREFIPYQVDQSKKDLEKWFHTPVNIFIYPKWRYTYATLDQLRLSGYKYAFTTQTGTTNLTEKPLELKRFDVIPWMTEENFAQLVNWSTENTTVEK